MLTALLFVRSFRNLMVFDPGMREACITVADISFQEENLPPDRWHEFTRRLLEDAAATPGIDAAATTTIAPLLGSGWGHGVRMGAMQSFAMFTGVSPSYLDTMEIPLLAGRNINASDVTGGQHVAIVSVW